MSSPTGRCCTRVLIDTGYIGHKYEQHEAERTHRWVDDGDVCCGSPAGFRHQSCYCGAGRWTECSVTAAQIVEGAVDVSKIARWSQDHALVTAHEGRCRDTRFAHAQHRARAAEEAQQ